MLTKTALKAAAATLLVIAWVAATAILLFPPRLDGQTFFGARILGPWELFVVTLAAVVWIASVSIPVGIWGDRVYAALQVRYRRLPD